MAAPLPPPAAFATLFGTLLGIRPKVAKGTSLVVNKLHTVATYVDDKKEVIYAAVADTPFVAAAGAALAMIPARLVADCIAKNAPTETMIENTYEVLNISASLFNEIDQTHLHVKIAEMTTQPKLAPVTVAKLGKPTGRLDLVVSIPGYPDGKLTLLSLQ